MNMLDMLIQSGHIIKTRQHPHLRLFDIGLNLGMNALSSAVIVNNQNVMSHLTDHYAGSVKNSWNLGKVFNDMKKVSIRPPFEKMWIEHKSVAGSGSLCGYLIDSSGIEDTHTFMMSYYGYTGRYFMHEGVWAIEMDDEWNFKDDRNLFSLTALTGDKLAMESANGRCVATIFTLGLLNCRNIRLVDQSIKPSTVKQYERTYKRPMIVTKTLSINSTLSQSKKYDDPKEYQGLMPLHLRRGNFAHYTEENPLFGKYTGTFWRPATTVGERKNGVVIKDYEVSL